MFNLKLSKDIVYSVLFLLGSFSYLIYLYAGSFIFLAVFFVIGFCLYGSVSKLYIKNEIIVFSVFSVFMFNFFGFFSPNSDFQKMILSFLYMVSCVGFSINLYFNKYNIILSKILFLGFSIFLIINFISMGLFSFDLFNDIFHSSSRNVVSAVLICLLLNLILVTSSKGESLNFLYFFSCLFFCVLLYGRTGIFISLLLLLYKMGTYLKNIYSLVFVALIVFICSIYVEYLLQFLEENTNLSRGLESPRSLIFSEYFQALFLNSKNFLLGAEINKCCQYAVLFNENLHNSFLYAHSRFGFASILYMIISTIFIFSTRKFTIIFIYCTLVLRYFYDQLGFFGIFDITFYILLIMSCVSYGLISERSNG